MPGFPLIRTVAHCFRTISSVVVDLVRLAFFAVHSRRALAAENLFFRKLGFRWRGGCWGGAQVVAQVVAIHPDT